MVYLPLDSFLTEECENELFHVANVRRMSIKLQCVLYW